MQNIGVIEHLNGQVPGAATFLGITIVLGVALASDLRWGILGIAHALAVATHLTVALSAWVSLVVIGVSQRLLPMFLLRPGARGALGGLGGGRVGGGILRIAAVVAAGDEDEGAGEEERQQLEQTAGHG